MIALVNPVNACYVDEALIQAGAVSTLTTEVTK